MKKNILLIVVLNLFQHLCFAQNASIDSLLKVLETAKEDTNKVRLYNTLFEKLFQAGSYDEAGKYAEIMLQQSQKIGYRKGEAASYNKLGVYYRRIGNNTQALKSHENALKIREEIKDSTGIATSLYNIGNVLMEQSNNKESLNKYNAALALYKKLANRQGEADCYSTIGNLYLKQGEYQEALKSIQLALRIKEEIKDSLGIALAYNNIGNVYLQQGNYSEALENHKHALKLREQIGQKDVIASSYHNIGDVYIMQGNYSKALECFLNALKIREATNDKKAIAVSYNSIGLMYQDMENYTEALKHHFASLKIKEEIGDKAGASSSYNNIGVIYSEQKKYEEALKYLTISLNLKIETGSKKGIASSYGNIGILCYETGNYFEAVKNLTTSIELKKNIGDKRGIANSYCYMGLTNLKLKKFNEAKKYLNDALLISQEIGSKDVTRDTYNGLSALDSATGNFKSALEHYKLYTLYKDSLLNEDNNKQIAQMKTIYETEKKDAEITLLNKDKEIQEKEIAKQKLVRNGFVGGFGLTLLLAASIFFSLQQNKKKNKIITAQKLVVEEKNRHITDSIQYALRIQTAILPPEKLVKEHLNNSFVLYMPKDIVAGDFYWMETIQLADATISKLANANNQLINTSANQLILFAACDCTGHGVPGAMVSVMCHNALNRAVREYGLTQPAKILDKVVELVQDNFTKSEDEIQDGMDTSLCAYYPEQRRLEWAGANNPLWIIRNGEIIEYKPDKQPIGKYEYRKPYTNHEIELQQGDTIYIFSDGYHDQFGDDGNKKLTKKGLKQILLSIQHLNMDRQHEELTKLHTQWKGQIEQIDDICVIGVRV